MRIAVTGASGFVGSWLVPELIAHGHIVTPADAELDLLDAGAVESWLTGSRAQVVYHLAAQVGRLFGEDDVVRTVRTNAEMTTVLAHHCGRLGVRLVYVSSSEVYGDQGEAVCDEVDGPFSLPHNLYGLTKRWGEEAARLYAPDRLVIARLSMPYGPGVSPGRGRRAMDTMLWQAHHRLPITVHRGAERSWCWVGDTVAGLRMVGEQPEAGMFNIGRDDDPQTMLELAQRACDLAGTSHDLIRLVDAPYAQTVVKRLSTERLQRLGWKPTMDLHDGLPLVYGWVIRFDADGRFVG